MDKKRLVPTDIVVYKEVKKEEIDLLELLKVIYRYKKFILLSLITSLVLTFLYLNYTKPIYKIEAQIELGSYINSSDKKEIKSLFIEPNKIRSLIEYRFVNKKYKKQKYPKVEVLEDNTLLSLDIEAFSNSDAIKYLEKIVNFIKAEELNSLNNYKSFLKNEIKVLNNLEKEYSSYIKELKKSLETKSDTKSAQSALLQISEYNNLIIKNRLDINRYNYLLSSVQETKLIKNIKKSETPYKPKKTLVILVVLIATLLVAIFISFLLESVKNKKL